MSESSPSSNELREAVAAYRVGQSADDLELPVNRDFHLPPPRLTPVQYVAWCEAQMKMQRLKPMLPEEPPRARPVFELK
jgi:hypothetical protein